MAKKNTDHRKKQLAIAQTSYRGHKKTAQFKRLQAWIPKESFTHLKNLCAALDVTQAEVIAEALSAMARDCAIIKKARS